MGRLPPGPAVKTISIPRIHSPGKSSFVKPENNPYCYYRARTFAKQNLREKGVLDALASGAPFDHALFHIEVKALDAPEAPAPERRQTLLQIRRKSASTR